MVVGRKASRITPSWQPPRGSGWPKREQHHPDLHLEGYRRLWIEIYPHTIGGLSENDLILAAKIDSLMPTVSGRR